MVKDFCLTRGLLRSLLTLLCCMSIGTMAFAQQDATIEKWLKVFSPSVLSHDDQVKEMKWFAEAAKPFC